MVRLSALPQPGTAGPRIHRPLAASPELVQCAGESWCRGEGLCKGIVMTWCAASPVLQGGEDVNGILLASVRCLSSLFHAPVSYTSFIDQKSS